MATSGTTTFDLNIDDIIQEAYSLLLILVKDTSLVDDVVPVVVEIYASNMSLALEGASYVDVPAVSCCSLSSTFHK